jgi:hypothetical protein
MTIQTVMISADYRRRARDAVDAASITTYPSMRLGLLKLAAVWGELAERADLYCDRAPALKAGGRNVSL